MYSINEINTNPIFQPPAEFFNEKDLNNNNIDIYNMLNKEILNSHAVSVLKKEISKTNVKGYSKMNKKEVVELMLKNKDRFSHIKHARKPTPSAPTPPTKNYLGYAVRNELKKPLSAIDKEKMENWQDEDAELKPFENGKKKMTMKEYLRFEKRFDKLRFFVPDLGNLDRRLEKLKPK